MGLIFACMGIFIGLLALGVIPSDPGDMRAPRWVITIVGAMFLLMGMWIVLRVVASQGNRPVPVYRWTEFFILLGVMGAFSAVFLWIGFGPGEREFSGSSGFGPFRVETSGDDNLLDRLIFGGFGVIAGLMTLWFAAKQAWELLNSQPGNFRDKSE